MNIDKVSVNTLALDQQLVKTESMEHEFNNEKSKIFEDMIDETSKSLTDNFIESNESDITISPPKVNQVN